MALKMYFTQEMNW